ncbi:MAG: hypothetical protein LC637_10375 [Xanthomonadaceae bacterium]|nr:hypothetical protein [Xanthomonadaceae bacterium]
MNLLQCLRKHAASLARINAGLFVLLWLVLVATPCVMAMQMDSANPEHRCPHCPPAPCHEVQPDDCDVPERLDLPRLADKTPSLDLLNLRSVLHAIPQPAHVSIRSPRALPPVRDGPRAHLVHVQFNE